MKVQWKVVLLMSFMLMFYGCSHDDVDDEPDVVITISAKGICFGSDQGVQVISNGGESTSRLWCEGNKTEDEEEDYEHPYIFTFVEDTFCYISTRENVKVGMKFGDRDIVTEERDSFCYSRMKAPNTSDDEDETY